MYLNNIKVISKILDLSSKTTKKINNTSKEILILEGFLIKIKQIL